MLLNLSPEYWFLLILLFLSAALKKYKFFLYICIAYMLLIACFRNVTVGTDYMGYYDDFKMIKNFHSMNLIRHSRFEEGFVGLILLFKSISSDYMTFIGIITFIMIVSVISGMKRLGVPIVYGILVYVLFGEYFVSFNIIRQMFVISLVMSFVYLLYQGRYMAFGIITVVVALLFHRTEVVLLLLIPFHIYTKNNPVINKKFLYICLFGSFILFYIGHTVMAKYFSVISNIGFMNMYESYITGFWTEEEHGNTVALMYTFYSAIIIFCKDKNTRAFETYTFIFSICVFNVFNIFPTYASRIYHDFFMIVVYLVPLMMIDPNTRYRRIFNLATIVFGLGWVIYSYAINNQGEINPFIFRSL